MKDNMKKSATKDTSTMQKHLTELGEMESNWKRALADYKNLQKRVEEEKEEIVSFSNMVLLSRLLPVLDNLELLEKHSNDEGLKMIIKEFTEVLKEAGIEEVDPEGKEFDPMTMEAIEMGEVEEEKATDAKLKVSTVRKGYKMKDRLIRPARVVVNKE